MSFACHTYAICLDIYKEIQEEKEEKFKNLTLEVAEDLNFLKVSDKESEVLYFDIINFNSEPLFFQDFDVIIGENMNFFNNFSNNVFLIFFLIILFFLLILSFLYFKN